jgi:hypothetical protein
VKGRGKQPGLPPGAVLAVGHAAGGGEAEGEGGRCLFQKGEALRIAQVKEKSVEELIRQLGTIDLGPGNNLVAQPPPRRGGRARRMADTFQALLAEDPTFSIKSAKKQHAAVLDKIGLSPEQRKETGWSAKGLFNELSRRRRGP